MEARNTKYRFDPERDIRWDDMDLPGMYFTGETIGGIDPSLFDSISGLSETFNWAMGISTSEYFIALEKHLIRFFKEEVKNGHLPVSRSIELFEEEEVKHIRLFRRFADMLKAKRPDVVGLLDKHLKIFEHAWWRDPAGNYPSIEIYHFVNWLNAVLFEEYTLYLYDVLKQGHNIQPAWLSAHYAHMREETQHVITDMAYLERLDLDDKTREHWGRRVMEKQFKRFGEDMSMPIAATWKFLMELYPNAEMLSPFMETFSSLEARKQDFLNLINYKNFFLRTKNAGRFSTFEKELFPGRPN